MANFSTKARPSIFLSKGLSFSTYLAQLTTWAGHSAMKALRRTSQAGDSRMARHQVTSTIRYNHSNQVGDLRQTERLNSIILCEPTSSAPVSRQQPRTGAIEGSSLLNRSACRSRRRGELCAPRQLVAQFWYADRVYCDRFDVWGVQGHIFKRAMLGMPCIVSFAVTPRDIALRRATRRSLRASRSDAQALQGQCA